MSTNLGLGWVRSGPLGSGGRRARAVRGTQPSWPLIAAFAAFVASLAFVPGGEGSVRLSRFLGYALFGLALLQPRVCFKRPARATWWFVIYVGLYAVRGLLQPTYLWPAIYGKALTLIQLLVVLWLGFNLMRYERMVKWWLLGFGLASVGMAILLVGGVETSIGGGGRETVFGQGPHVLAATIACGALTLIGLAYRGTSVGRMTKLAALGGFLIVGVAITRTGSRAAMVELGVGLIALLVSRGSARARVRNAAIVVVGLSFCYWITISSGAAAGRWQATLEEGNMSGRQSIYADAWKMFEEKPLFGWGPAMNAYELGVRRNTPARDTHNLFLWLLTELGLIGTIPFLIGLALCVRAAWRGRKGPQGILPFALLMASVTVNLADTFYLLKLFWVILAYSLASETYLGARVRWTGLSKPGRGLMHLPAPKRRRIA